MSTLALVGCGLAAIYLGGGVVMAAGERMSIRERLVLLFGWPVIIVLMMRDPELW